MFEEFMRAAGALYNPLVPLEEFSEDEDLEVEEEREVEEEELEDFHF